MFAVPSVRRRVILRLRPLLRRSIGSAAHALRTPGKLALLLGGSAVVTLSYIACVYLTTRAFGGDLSLASVGAVYLIGSALAAAAPPPAASAPWRPPSSRVWSPPEWTTPSPSRPSSSTASPRSGSRYSPAGRPSPGCAGRSTSSGMPKRRDERDSAVLHGAGGYGARDDGYSLPPRPTGTKSVEDDDRG